MTGAWLAVVLLAVPKPAVDLAIISGPRAETGARPDDVTVQILSNRAIWRASVDRALVLETDLDGVLEERPGRPAHPVQGWSGEFRQYGITVNDQPRLEYQGALTIRSANNRLCFFLRMHLEDYVAAVVASETTPGTSRAALEAQAIVVRSYAIASPDRHDGAKFCDLAHCQWLHGRVDPDHRAAALDATNATAGRVLLLADGSVAATPFHASCGGHTADPVEVFGAPDDTGAAAVDDPGCPLNSWGTFVTPLNFDLALRRVLQASGAVPLPSSPEELFLVKGKGGYVVQVMQPGGQSASGDAFARALDQAEGYGQVRSSRFTLSSWQGKIWVRGSGLGHGVGLCQAGAARLALQGESAQAILAHYFPKAHLSE